MKKPKLNTIICGDALEVLKTWPDEFVDMIITSSPYFSLRDYGEETKTVWGGDENCKHKWGGDISSPGERKGEKHPKVYGSREVTEGRGNFPASNFCSKCGAWKGQLGLEPTLDLYLEHMLWITKELKRVLKPKGTLWWVHGDSYSSGGGKSTRFYEGEQGKHLKDINQDPVSGRCRMDEIPHKSLTLQNFRLAQRMIDEQGWILRNVIIWYKPNCMPSSAKDRLTVDFEPVFFFSKNQRYYFEQQFEPVKPESLEREKYGWEESPMKGRYKVPWEKREGTNDQRFTSPKGRNKRTVWEIPTASFPEAHFAVYSEKLITTPIKAGCPKEICKKCGKAREKIVDDSERIDTRPGKDVGFGKSGTKEDPNASLHKRELSTKRQKIIYKEKGYTDCGCNAGWRKGIVLDPFIGSGTTAKVAEDLARNWIGIELNKDYIKIANKRLAQRSLLKA